MNKILIVFAHPRFEKSRTNRALLADIDKQPGVTLNDLYELYPDFNVDIERERKRLLEHQVIIWHHPLYMYGAPALLKQWIDLVLDYGWAHGKGGRYLENKLAFNALTTGGTRDVYVEGGRQRFTIRQFLAPFEQTANLCNMIYLPPFVVHGTYRLTAVELKNAAALYRSVLQRLYAAPVPVESMSQLTYLNDWTSSLPEGVNTP